MRLDSRELATVLAALRHWQASLYPKRPCSAREQRRWLNDIATNGGESRRLTPTEIDVMCESLNQEGPCPVRIALREFVRDINQTGGVSMDAEGCAQPIADLDWIDLGDTYLKACAALSIRPKRVRQPE